MRNTSALPCLVLTACASAPSTTEELGKNVIGAARAGDVSAFERLYWSPIASGEVCEPSVGEALAKERIGAHRPFAACRRDIAWDDVGGVHVMGGAAVRPLKKCGGRAIELENIVVTFEMSGAHGPEFGRFVLEDAVSYDDHYYLGGGFECRDVPKGFAACRDIVHRVTQRSAKEIGTLAFEIVGPLIQNCETLDAGRQAQLATCVDSASDVNALDACFLQAHGLPSEPDGADGPGRPPGSLPRSCERFLAAYESCIETMPEAARAPVRDGLEQMRRAWADAPHDALESGCQAAFDAARDSLSTICPGVWPDAPSHP